jgi:hypothetical protein
MKLPANTLLLRRKASEYLLQKRRDDDKSGFLALAGYTAHDADRPQWPRPAGTDPLDERKRDRRHKICYLAAGQSMKYDLFIRVALSQDLPGQNLRCGDVATIVESHPGRPGQEPGYTLEVFNAVGHSVAVVTVRESQIEPLTADEMLTVRPLAGTAH